MSESDDAPGVVEIQLPKGLSDDRPARPSGKTVRMSVTRRSRTWRWPGCSSMSVELHRPRHPGQEGLGKRPWDPSEIVRFRSAEPYIPSPVYQSNSGCSMRPSPKLRENNCK